MDVLAGFLIIGTMLASFYYYMRKMHYRVPATTWEIKELYESGESKNKVDEESILLSWLRERPQMIHALSSI